MTPAQAIVKLAELGLPTDKLAAALSVLEAMEEGFKAPVEERRKKDRERAKFRKEAYGISDREWFALRSTVLNRDNFTCAYCGHLGANQIDHIIPISKGGPTVLDNLTTACQSCNSAKGNRLVEEWSSCL